MKNLIIIVLMLFYSATYATNYYVSWSNGNDNNNGTSPLTAWKSIYEIATHTFTKGDSLFFKSGDVWLNDGNTLSNDFPLIINVSGGSGVFYVGSYGIGDIPKIDGNKQLPDWQISENWELYSTGIYRRLNFDIGNRLWLNGKERKESPNLTLTDEFPWRVQDGNLYVKSAYNPATYFNSMSYSPSLRTAFQLINQSDITIDGLSIGGAGTFVLTNCKNVIIENCKLGYRNGGKGISITANNNDSTKNIIIRNNIFNSGDSLYYNYYRGLHSTDDAIWVGDGSIGTKIISNYFYGWSHSAIHFIATNSSYPFHDNEAYNNFITAPLIDYGRGIAVVYHSNGYKNSMHHNTIVNTTVVNQLGGSGFKFYDNIIDNVAGCPYPEKYGVGQGIGIASYGEPNINMEIFNNTILNCEYTGIRIYAGQSDIIEVSNNNIHDNNIFNNGNLYPFQLITFNSQVIHNNTYQNNHFYNLNSKFLVKYGLADLTVNEFNNFTTINNDIILGNDSILKFGAYTTTLSDLRIEYNNTGISKIINLEFPSIDKNGTKYPATYTLQPYSSIILLKDPNPLQPASQKKPIRIDGKIIGIKSQNIIFGI